MSRSALPLVASALVALWALPATAGGLASSEPNAAALGRAGAAAAAPDGASAVAYNPAGITLVRGLALQVGVGFEVDRTRVTLSSDGSRATSSITTVLPDLFVAQRLGDHAAVGFGIYRTTTQSLTWPGDFAERYRVQRASFGGSTLQPTFAGRPFSWLSVGVGLAVLLGNVDVGTAVGDARYEVAVRGRGHATALGGVVGLWARLYRDWLTFGFNYRSTLDLDVRGRFLTSPRGSDVSIGSRLARIHVPFPHQLTFALASRPASRTLVAFEARVLLLRDLHELEVTDRGSPPATLLRVPMRPHELVQLRLGAEQRVARDHLVLRLGVGYDLGSLRRDLDPALPDGDRVVVAGGLGVRAGGFAIDAGYLAALSPGHTANRGYATPATYDQARHTASLTFAVQLDHVGPKRRRFQD